MKMKRKLRRKRYKKRSVLRRLFTALIICFFFVCAITASGIAYIATTATPIDPSDIYSRIEQTSSVYDRDGNLIDTLFYEEDRVLVDISSIPASLKCAVIAIEDKTFYKHYGFNLKRMAGAILYRLIGKADQIGGTSTITQQLARNIYLSDTKSERTIKRKATEMWYAWQIEQAMSKDEILEAYLNSIYLGYGCYGVGSASKTYFSKDVSELTTAESAALAALPQAPDAYALLSDEDGEGRVKIKVDGKTVYSNDLSKDRRNLTLSLMVEQGYLSEAAASDADVDIADILKPDLGSKSSNYTYFIDYLSSELVRDFQKERGLTSEEADRLVHTGGLKIYTTIDAKAQKAIISEFKDGGSFPSCVDGKTEPEAAMVIADNKTGEIVAMVGGRKGSGKKLFNRAISPRQPGSSIKPLSVYSAALQKSCELKGENKKFPLTDFGYDKQGIKYWGNYITAGSYVVDEKMTVGGRDWPKNATKTYSGTNTFRTALQQSINTCAVKIQLQVTSDYSVAMLKKYGISTLEDNVAEPVNDLNPAALALGAMSYGVTPLDMALAYTTFPNNGEKREPKCYTRVTDANDELLLEKESPKERVLDEGVAWIMADILKTCVSKGIASDASLPDVQAGGKTGTTNDAYDIWFCGFTPKYSAALWIGTDLNVEMNTTSRTAAALWSKIMRNVPSYASGGYEVAPSNVITYKGEYYTKGTEGGATAPTKRKSTSKSSSSSSSDSSAGSESPDSVPADSGSRRQFVRNFTGNTESGNGSSNSNGGSSTRDSNESSSSGSSSRSEWLKRWQGGD